MRLKRLLVERLPGIERPLEFEGIAPGVNVIVGPNASGKSSLLRALLALLYPSLYSGQLRVTADLDLERLEGCRAERLGESSAWSRAGSEISAPRLVPHELRGSYFVRLEDLVIEPPAPARHRKGRGAAKAATSRDATAGPTDLDRDIARAVVRELTGGIDLRAVLDGFGRLDNKGRAAAGELRDRLQELGRLRDQRDALRQREESLPVLEEQRVRASEAAAGAEPAQVALELVANRAELAGLESRLAALGPGFRRLDEGAGDRFDAAIESLRSAQERREMALGERAEAESGIAELALPEAPPTEQDARARVEAAERLIRELTGLEEVKRRGANAAAQRSAALARIGVAPAGAASGPTARTRPPDLAPAALGRVDSLLAERVAADARVERTGAELEALASASDVEAALAGEEAQGSVSEGALTAAEAALAAWLDRGAGARLEGGPARWIWAVGGALAGTAVAVARTLTGALSDWPVWAPPLAAGALVAALLAAIVAPARASVRSARRAAEGAFERSGLAPPDAWSEAAVVRRLHEVVAEREQLKRAVDERRTLAARRTAAEAAHNRALSGAADARNALARLRREAGYAPELPDAGLVGWLHAVGRAQELQDELVGLTAELKRLSRSTQAAREGLLDFLRANGVELAQQASPDEVLAACRTLESRVRTRGVLLVQLQASERQAASAAADSERAFAALMRLLHELDLDAEDHAASRLELQRRLLLLPQWTELSRAVAAAKVRVEGLEKRLERWPELLALAESQGSEALEARASDGAAAAHEVTRLTEEIHEIRVTITNAASQRRLERAAANVAEARDRLSEHRDRALRLAAAEYFLGSIERQHRAAVQPAALELAKSWFARFTAGRFELGFEAEAGAGRRLVAFDNEVGARRELGELSTGTRAQLLLASRVAYAVSEEGRALWEPLPLFLDEALTTADPARFEEVAGALLGLAAAGRQVFYLSARPEDARAWQDAAHKAGESVRVHDLSALAEATEQERSQPPA